MKQLQDNIQQAVVNMENARDKQAHYANQHRRDYIFKEGEEVLLSTKNLKLPEGITHKLSNRYTGPFKIVQVISPTSYKLELPAEWKNKHPVFHVSLLKKYTPSSNSDTSSPSVIDIDLDDEEVEYEVDKVIGQRTFNKQTEYLVTWKGYPESEATWETRDNVKDLKAMDEYEQARQAKHSRVVNSEYIHDKWKLKHIQQYLRWLQPPASMKDDISRVLNMVKTLRYTGQEFVRLTPDILTQMNIQPSTGTWLMEQIEKLLDSQVVYPITV
jgi:Chromo (CHRromatin Organisation MOdifier) domain